MNREEHIRQEERCPVCDDHLFEKRLWTFGVVADQYLFCPTCIAERTRPEWGDME